MVVVNNTENNLSFTGWHLGIGLFVSMNFMVFLGLKLPWFKSRINIGHIKKDKEETVQVVGFRRISEFPTYTPISEFAAPSNSETQRNPHRTPNPEVALKIHNMLSKSMINLPTKNEELKPKSTRNNEELKPKSTRTNEELKPKSTRNNDELKPKSTGNNDKTKNNEIKPKSKKNKAPKHKKNNKGNEKTEKNDKERKGERNEYIGEHSGYMGEPNEYIGDHSGYMREPSGYMREPSGYMGDRNEYMEDRNEYMEDRNEYMEDRKEYMGVRNEYMGEPNDYDEQNGYHPDWSEYRDERTGYGKSNEYEEELSEYLEERNDYKREYNEDIWEGRGNETERNYIHNETKSEQKPPKSILKKKTNYIESQPNEDKIENGFSLLLGEPEMEESEGSGKFKVKIEPEILDEWGSTGDMIVFDTKPSIENKKPESSSRIKVESETGSKNKPRPEPRILKPQMERPERLSLMEELIFPKIENMYDDNNSHRSDTPPTVNYATLPKSSFKPSNYIYDLNKKYENEPKRDDFQEIDLNAPSEEFSEKTLAKELYNEEFKPYVIEINEGDEDPGYEAVNKERSVRFDPVYDKIDDRSELYDNIMETLAERNVSEGSYDNDYTNTKRTSYFQTGNSTYSSQAANIFFGGKKPEPPPRRQTARFETTC